MHRRFQFFRHRPDPHTLPPLLHFLIAAVGRGRCPPLQRLSLCCSLPRHPIDVAILYSCGQAMASSPFTVLPVMLPLVDLAAEAVAVVLAVLLQLLLIALQKPRPPLCPTTPITSSSSPPSCSCSTSPSYPLIVSVLRPGSSTFLVLLLPRSPPFLPHLLMSFSRSSFLSSCSSLRALLCSAGWMVFYSGWGCSAYGVRGRAGAGRRGSSLEGHLLSEQRRPLLLYHSLSKMYIQTLSKNT